MLFIINLYKIVIESFNINLFALCTLILFLYTNYDDDKICINAYLLIINIYTYIYIYIFIIYNIINNSTHYTENNYKLLLPVYSLQANTAASPSPVSTIHRMFIIIVDL